MKRVLMVVVAAACLAVAGFASQASALLRRLRWRFPLRWPVPAPWLLRFELLLEL